MAERELVTVEASSLEEALQEAAAYFALSPENLSGELVDTGKKLFGLFGKKNTYQVGPKSSSDMLLAWSILHDMAQHMGASIEPGFGEDNVLEIKGEDRDVFLGEHGSSLHSLEYLLNLILRDQVQGWIRLDSDGYRELRLQGLEEAALAAAEEACRRRRPISLQPMTSWERRIVHLALKERDDVETRSMGENPARRVVVWPKNGRRGRDRQHSYKPSRERR